MTGRIVTKTEKFRPFTLEIDVESQDDLEFLWMMFNMLPDEILEINYNDRPTNKNYDVQSAHKTKIWELLDKKIGGSI